MEEEFIISLALEMGVFMLGSGLLVAVTEELFYRGLVQGILSQRFKPWIVISAASFVFSAFHISYWIIGNYDPSRLPVPQFFVGIILGVLFWKSKSIWLPLFVHVWMNFLGVFLTIIAWLIIL